ncbi:MAG: hypothetical protein P8R54_05740 [Myxococcota bacterium]|nr:hypothetical protein [Myxococcota bacterium]
MLLSILVLTGCDSDTPAVAGPTVPEPLAPPEMPASPASPEAPETPPEAEIAAYADAPFHQPVQDQARIDGLTFWGWSADSTVFAFETYYPGSGALSCDDTATLHVVSAETDQYLTPPITTRYPSIETDDCAGPSPQEALSMLRGDILKTFDISARHYIPPVVNTEASMDWLVEPASGPLFRLQTTLTGTGSPGDYEADAGFKLEMFEVGHAGMPKLIESGARMRAGIFDYLPAMVFCAPDDSHVAILIQTSRLDFEGHSYGFMSNGTARIPDMVVDEEEP